MVINYKNHLHELNNKKLREKRINVEEYEAEHRRIQEINPIRKINVITAEELKKNITANSIIKFENFPVLNKALKLAQNDLLVIGAMTGQGKTGFLLNLMNDLMNNYQCIYFNIEMSKSNMYKRIISIKSGIPIYKLSEELTLLEQAAVDKAYKDLENSKFIIEHQTNKVSDIKKIVSKLKDKSRHTILFIDHLGLLRIEGKNSLYEQMTEIMKELRNICMDYDCTIIGASQLNRSAYQAEELTVSMLKDSGELENSARKIIMLYRDKDYDSKNPKPLMYADIQKNDNGGLGIVRMIYDKAKQIFKEVEE